MQDSAKKSVNWHTGWLGERDANGDLVGDWARKSNAAYVCRREVSNYLSMGDCPRTLGGSQPSSRRARNEGLEGDVDRAVPTGARSS